jgi:hypothetical protein
MPTVGFLRDSTAAGSEFMVNGLRKGSLGLDVPDKLLALADEVIE